MDFCMRMAKQFMVREVERRVGKNLVLSPLSINAVLNMVAAGTTGRSLEHMLGYLGSNDITEINSKSSEMMAVASGAVGSSENTQDGPVLSMLNGVWVDKRFPVKPSYQELLKGIYNCEPKNVDFLSKADEVRREVNSWAESASRGLITNILESGSVTPATAVILANALYFKGTWVDEFEVASTENREFFLLNGDTVSVPFMTSGGLQRYGSFDDFKVLGMQYRSSGESNRSFSMYLFLPDEEDGLQSLLDKFNSDPGFLQRKEYFNLSQVYLDYFWIPKFKFSFGFDVSAAMDDVGARLPSMKDTLDFKEMVHIPKGLPFFVSNMIQKAFIEMDEKGTEATAVTVCGLLGSAMRQKREILSFVADHPFMFVIKEETSGLVFFTGAVLNPIRD